MIHSSTLKPCRTMPVFKFVIPRILYRFSRQLCQAGLLLALLLTSFRGLSQVDPATIKIVSGSKVIYSDQGAFSQIIQEAYLANFETIQAKAFEKFKEEVKATTGQTSYSEDLELSQSVYIDIKTGEEGKVLLQVSLPVNSLMFRMTTPDNILGFGASRNFDPRFIVIWEMQMEFELSSAGNLEQLNSFYKGIRIKELSNNSHKMDVSPNLIDMFVANSSFVKDDINLWLGRRFPYYLWYITNPLGLALNQRIRDYLDKEVKANKSLLAEIAIDESNKLLLRANERNELVCEHPYSSTGISKRAATTDPSGILSGPDASRPKPPPSSKPSDIRKGPATKLSTPKFN